MTTQTDPATGAELPPGSIQRILFLAPKVHVFQVPPLTSTTKGHVAAQWTTKDPIFTARVRIFETSVPKGGSASAGETVTVSILLEDAKTGELFAEAPYTHPSAVQQCQDSSRFFALRVEGPGPGGKKMKATLGIGFEERSEAFDFGVSLADGSKVLGFGAGAGGQDGSQKGKTVEQPQKDYTLKEDESLVINFGSKGRRVKRSESKEEQGPMPILAPPPSAAEVRKAMRSQPGTTGNPVLDGPKNESGFDDDFGDFQ